MPKAGHIRGRHYTTYVDDVRQLKRTGQLEAAVKLLLELVAATEAEASAEGCGVAPWYYEQLAILYAKQKEGGKELAILERYQAQRHAAGIGPSKLADRLAKARKLMSRHV